MNFDGMLTKYACSPKSCIHETSFQGPVIWSASKMPVLYLLSVVPPSVTHIRYFFSGAL